MSSLSGLPVPVVAAGAAALGAGAATAFHRSSRGGSRRRRTPRAVILVEEPAPRASHRARDRALALDASSASTAASAAFPLASRASARGILFDADGEPVAIPPRDGFGPGALLVTGAVSSALAVALTRLAVARRAAGDDTALDDDSSHASHDPAAAAKDAPALPARPPSHPASRLANLRAAKEKDAAGAAAGPRRDDAPSLPRHHPSAASSSSAAKRAGFDAVASELRALMEESPLQSPLDSSFELSAYTSAASSPFATPAREAMSALRRTAEKARAAGAPFPDAAVRRVEAIVRSAEMSACASACASGGHTPKRGTEDENDEGTTKEAKDRAVGAAAEGETTLDAAPRAALRPVTKLDAAREARRAFGEVKTMAEDVAAATAGLVAERGTPGEPNPALASAAGKENDPRGLDSPECSASARAARIASEAEDRYRAARERLRDASSAASGERPSAGDAGAGDASGGPPVPPGASRDAATPESKPSASLARLSARDDVAAKVEAALARSRLAQERIHAAALAAAREAREAAAKVRAEWARAPTISSRASWSNRSESESVPRLSPRGAVPASAWAVGDEAAGKTDVFDRFMGALSNPETAEADRGADTEEGASRPDEDASGEPPAGSSPSATTTTSETLGGADDRAPGGGTDVGGAEGGPRATNEEEEEEGSPLRGGARLEVSLSGEAREGETLTLRVDASESRARGLGLGPVVLRWQRAKVPSFGDGDAPAPASTPARDFRTIPGAREATYTLTGGDVGCVIRAVAAADARDGSGGVGGQQSVFAAAQTDRAVERRG